MYFKKILSAALAVALAGTLSGCFGNDEPEPQQPVEAPPVDTSQGVDDAHIAQMRNHLLGNWHAESDDAWLQINEDNSVTLTAFMDPWRSAGALTDSDLEQIEKNEERFESDFPAWVEETLRRGTWITFEGILELEGGSFGLFFDYEEEVGRFGGPLSFPRQTVRDFDELEYIHHATEDFWTRWNQDVLFERTSYDPPIGMPITEFLEWRELVEDSNAWWDFTEAWWREHGDEDGPEEIIVCEEGDYECEEENEVFADWDNLEEEGAPMLIYWQTNRMTDLRQTPHLQRRTRPTRVISVIPEGAPVEVLGQFFRHSWMPVRFNGNTGYVLATHMFTSEEIEALRIQRLAPVAQQIVEKIQEGRTEFTLTDNLPDDLPAVGITVRRDFPEGDRFVRHDRGRVFGRYFARHNVEQDINGRQLKDPLPTAVVDQDVIRDATVRFPQTGSTPGVRLGEQRVPSLGWSIIGSTARLMPQELNFNWFTIDDNNDLQTIAVTMRIAENLIRDDAGFLTRPDFHNRFSIQLLTTMVAASGIEREQTAFLSNVLQTRIREDQGNLFRD